MTVQLKALEELKNLGFIQEAEFNRRKAEITENGTSINGTATLSSDFRLQKTVDADGSFKNCKWQCVIPGLANTPWEGGAYPLTIEFPNEYPQKPPRCKFPQGFLHPNVFPSGTVALPLLEKWNPSTDIEMIILGIQQFLNEHDLTSPAQQEAYSLAIRAPEEYIKRIRLQAQKYP